MNPGAGSRPHSGGLALASGPRPDAPRKIQNHLASAVNKAFTGTLSPRRALEEAAAEVNAILADR